MGLTEKVAYIKGLIDGLGIDEGTKEGKVLLAMADLLDDMADSIEDVQDGMELLSCQIDDIDDELDLMSDEDYDEDDDEDMYDDFEGELYEVTCPKCKNIVYMDEEMLDQGAVPCPNCGEPLEIDLDGVLDDCDCGHDHH